MSTTASRSRPLAVRLGPWALLALLGLGGIGVASLRLTAPIDDRRPPVPGAVASGPDPELEVADDPGSACEAAPIAWPADRLDGEPAKELLLAAMLRAERQLEATPAYMATMVRRERLGGVLGPEQTLAMKVRHRPFSIYLKFLTPKPGKEVLYVDGHRQNKLLAHNGDWTRRLVPRLEVEPTSALAMSDNRHPVTEAGLLQLARKLLHFRRLDLGDDDATTVLSRLVDDDGREWLRSTHEHVLSARSQRPFQYVTVEYDPETFIPLRVTCYDWPDSAAGSGIEARILAESYDYRDVVLPAALGDEDFDPANPAYAFTRY